MLPRLISYGHRTNTALSVVVLDVDRFKPVNDHHGHLAGDEVLKKLGKVLMDGRRREDVVARIGGEEFVIALPGIDRAGAERVAERVLESVRRAPFEVDGKSIQITLSAGVAELAAADDERALLARADAAMYKSKQKGRNQVSLAPANPPPSSLTSNASGI
jgi:diguanylate cyclase (GGDEF)-like protein